MKKAIVIIFSLMLLFSCAEEKNRASVSAANVAEAPIAISGEQIFNKRCVSCHGQDGKMGFSGAKDLTKSSLPLTMIEMQVTHGKGAMNGFEKILSKEEIKAVSVYAFKFRERI
jgi:cytochrome c6